MERAAFVGIRALSALKLMVKIMDSTTQCYQWRCLAHTGHKSESPSSSSIAQSPLDSFTAGLQSKTEQDLLQLIQNARLEKLKGNDEDEDALVDDDEKVNSETGELYGPRGKEPTRFGDWEHKGKCIDF